MIGNKDEYDGDDRGCLMRTYCIVVSKVVKRECLIKADSEEEALQIAQGYYSENMIDFDSDTLEHVNFHPKY